MNGAITNALNMVSVTAEEAPILKPMTLGRLLGSFWDKCKQVMQLGL